MCICGVGGIFDVVETVDREDGGDGLRTDTSEETVLFLLRVICPLANDLSDAGVGVVGRNRLSSPVDEERDAAAATNDPNDFLLRTELLLERLKLEPLPLPP